ncbi:MAG: GTP-binding protein [Desulfovibrio sp.]|jgi:small GTP-binding protein|nr:GTP-binding protein [Desulfovibrio sp.]
MITKKICMLGSFAVGKTALVQQYVHSIFSDRYLSTVGVKISKKNLVLHDQEICLVLWDLEGKDAYTEINISYMRGAMGFFLVADGTRRETLEIALNLRTLALNLTGPVPHCLLVNKADLSPAWEITRKDLASLREGGLIVLETSAKTGLGVEEAFAVMAAGHGADGPGGNIPRGGKE